MIKVFLMFLVIMLTGCSSMQAGKILESSKASYQVFTMDYLNFSNNSLEREWLLREAIRDEALRIETENTTFTAQAAQELAVKYMRVYKEDILAIEEIRTQHLKALSNARTAEELLKAVIAYHSSGLKTEEVDKFLVDQVLPTIAAIIDKEREK